MDTLFSSFSSAGDRRPRLSKLLFANDLKHCATLLAMAVGLGVAAGARAEERLGFEQALRLAGERSRLLVAQDSATTAARELAVAAHQLPDPTLKLGINNLPVNGADRLSLTRDFMTMRSVGVMQEFTRTDKRQARATRYEREAEAAATARTLALANLQRDTALAWLNRHYQEQLRAVLVVQQGEGTLQIEAADTAYRSGRGTQADVFAARAAMAQIEDRIAQSDRLIATANTRLARWVGEATDKALGAPPPMDALGLRADALESQLAHHPQLTLLEKQEQVALAEADIAKADKKPDWTAELMYSQRGSGFSNMISLNFSVPFPWDQAKRQDRQLAARLATAGQLRAQREEAAREHLAEVQTMRQEWQNNRERLARYDSAQIPLAKERTQATLAAYRGGSGSLASVLEARRMEVDTRMERLRLELETATLWAQLNFLAPADTVPAIAAPASR